MSHALDRLRQSAAETTRIAELVMHDPHATRQEFQEAFRARDVAHVQGLGYTEDQIAEARWETMAGANGNDSHFHTFFGLPSASDLTDEEWDREYPRDSDDEDAVEREEWATHRELNGSL